jgi:2-polyprenyl-3-methyl-5-hydroxy-6-metoxy-1,4-benzoquinol methylase
MPDPAPITEKRQLTERAVPGLHRSVLEFVLARFPKDISILDCGAGTGAWVEKLRSSGFRGLLAVDIEPGQYHGPAPFLRADLNEDFAGTVLSGDYTPSRQGFDLITAIEVIEHLDSPSAGGCSSRADDC